ncbi:MAG: TonB-dependent receptor [Terracidiphilus sp.]
MHISKCFQSVFHRPYILASLAFLAAMLTFSMTASAQAGGAIEGPVTDSTGAVVANAKVTASNIATGIATSRTTTSSGYFTINLLTPGNYTVSVSAQGFETLDQQNIMIDNEHVTGFNPVLRVGTSNETITVTDEPPALETTNATLGGTIRNEVYTELPIMLQTAGPSGQQRDITTFSNLLPGAQQPPGGRVSQFGGLPQRLAEVYVDGLPMTTANAQSDNRPVYNVIPIENIDQVQVMSSGFSAQSQGAGYEEFSTKSGGSQYHGAVFGLLRNTLFDAWTFASKYSGPGSGNVVTKYVNGVATTVPGPKNGGGEHMDEYGAAIGGPLKIPHISSFGNKFFIFGSYDRFRDTIGTNPTGATLPTTLMRTGNFQELLSVANGGLGNQANINYKIYDPTTQTACTANSTNGPCRYQYGYGPGIGAGAAGNPVLVSAANVNVIPANELSPQMQYLQKFLPAPTDDVVGAITNNYLGGTPTGFNNSLYAIRADYDVSDKNRIFGQYATGSRLAVPYNGSSLFPIPYVTSFYSHIVGHFAEVQDGYTISPHIANQLRYGYLYFGGPPIKNPTEGLSQYEPSAAGITGLPPGQASLDFPNVSFAGSNAQTTWNNGSQSYTSVSETYEVVDNLLWTKGRHAMNIGFEFQWLGNNVDSADSASQQAGFAMSTNETASLTALNAGTYITNTGYSYASFLLGAMGTESITQQPFTDYGQRFKPYAPYFQDDWKVSSKLTLNLGVRWDYMPTYREVLDRWSFLNPTAVNPITSTNGALEFVGKYGGAGVSCNCRTPVNDWHKNFGPRLGLAYQLNDKTILRAAYSIVYSHGGGVGGGSGADGTGSQGLQVQSGFSDSTLGASFYLNTNPNFPTTGGANVAGPNANFGGAGFTFPTVTGINVTAASTGILTGNYVCSGQITSPCYGRSGIYATASAQNYADPYYGGRAPEIGFYNFGIQRELTKAMTITVNYVGTQGHFLPGNNNLRGLQSNQVNPTYLTTAGSANLSKAATPANIAAVNTACGNCIPAAAPYPAYSAAAALNSAASIGHMLTWMPQYSGVNDTFGVMGANSEYNAMQLSLTQRMSQGLTFTVNYTYSKTLDDVGTIRSGYAIPAAAFNTYVSHQAWKADRIDRSRSTTDVPQLLTVFGVYKLPFGKGGVGSDHFAVRTLAGNWEISAIFQDASGLPLPIVGSAASPAQNFGQGQVMMDRNWSFSGSPRINGKWGQGLTSATIATRPYIQGYISSTTPGAGTNAPTCAPSSGPFCNTQLNTIGDTARVAPYGLRGPDLYRLTMSVNRTFSITDRTKFVFRVDCANVTNHVSLGNNFANQSIGVNPTSTAFGTVGIASNDSRAFQFQGRLNF